MQTKPPGVENRKVFIWKRKKKSTKCVLRGNKINKKGNRRLVLKRKPNRNKCTDLEMQTTETKQVGRARRNNNRTLTKGDEDYSNAGESTAGAGLTTAHR